MKLHHRAVFRRYKFRAPLLPCLRLSGYNDPYANVDTPFLRHEEAMTRGRGASVIPRTASKRDLFMLLSFLCQVFSSAFPVNQGPLFGSKGSKRLLVSISFGTDQIGSCVRKLYIYGQYTS